MQQSVMAPKLTRPTHKIVIQLHLVAESCTTCRSRSRRAVRKLLDTPLRSLCVSTTWCLDASIRMTVVCDRRSNAWADFWFWGSR